MKLRWWNDVRDLIVTSCSSLSTPTLALGPRPVPIGGPSTQEVWNGTGADETHNGTNADDTLNGMGGADIINGKAGNDDITGGAGNDELTGGDGNDTLRVGNGSDKAYGGKGDDLIKLDAGGGALIDLDGGKGDDTFDVSSFSGGTWTVNASVANIEHYIFSNFADTFTGQANNETFNGGNGDDRLDGGLGDDVIDGDIGFDLAIFTSATAAVNANLTTGTAKGGAGNDTLVEIEGLLGSTFNDKLTGDGNANDFAGFEGDDVIDGAGGIDRVFYNSIASGTVTINLKTGTATGTLGTDTLKNIEDAIGTGGNDNITGSDLANNLYGGGGNDKLFGGDGNDQVVGNDGNDELTGGKGSDNYYGGAGTDKFIFTNASSSAPATCFINDIVAGETIDLSAIDAIPGGADQAFIVFESFTGAPGEATVTFNGSQTVIALDINGGASPQADLIIVLPGNHITGSSPETYDVTIVW